MFTTNTLYSCIFVIHSSLPPVLQASLSSIDSHSSTRLGEYTEDGGSWTACAVADLHAHAAKKYVQRNPRRFAMQIMSEAGKLASLFSARPEGECTTPWQQWADRDMEAAAGTIAEVAVLCTALANAMSLDIGQVCGLCAPAPHPTPRRVRVA